MSSVIYSTIRDRLERRGDSLKLDPESRIIIFSDLHMGDGAKMTILFPIRKCFQKP